MNELDRAMLSAAMKKMLLIFAVVAITVFGGVAVGIIPGLILVLVGALFSGNDPAVGMMLSIMAIPLFYIGAPIGFVVALKWSWEHLVTESARESRRGFPVYPTLNFEGPMSSQNKPSPRPSPGVP